MKTLLAVIIFALSSPAEAIPVYKVIPEGISTQVNGEIIGYQQVLTGRYWTWHGKARKYDYVALYSTSPVPESDTYAMILVGLGLVGWRVCYRPRLNWLAC